MGAVDGSIVERTLEAPDEAAVRQEIARQGGRVFSIKKSAEAGLSFSLKSLLPRRRSSGVKVSEFLIFNQELVALLKAGLPIVYSFEILLERQENPRFKEILVDVKEKLTSGVALSDAFLAHGDVFPRLYATSLKAGERSGGIETVLRRYLTYQKILGSVRRKVTGALVYPAVLIGLSVSLVIILMTFVIPRFTEFYAGFGGELPLLTRVVVATALAMKKHVVEWSLGVVVLVWLFVRWKDTEAGRRSWDGILLKVPLVGKILHQFALSQFARSLATLVGAGTPLVPSLEISSGSIANQRIAGAVTSVVPKVREGAELWRSLEETKQFTSLTVEMVKVGEATGALEEMLLNVSDFYDESIDASLDRLVKLIEPVILIVMGGVIATILLSIYLPMFSLLSSLKT